jgi:predicted transcriptional regulator
MPTSIHLPKPLLDAIDRRARALKLSRNRLIVKALERELANGDEWSSGFFERLSETDSSTRVAVERMMAEVRARRSSKEPPKL